jgi:hypothetical protein
VFDSVPVFDLECESVSSTVGVSDTDVVRRGELPVRVEDSESPLDVVTEWLFEAKEDEVDCEAAPVIVELCDMETVPTVSVTSLERV